MKEINGPELNDLWARRIKDGGADFVCFVDVSMFPEKLTGGCGCAVLFGKALPKEYIRALAEGLQPEENALHNLKRKMDALSRKTAAALEAEGYRSIAAARSGMLPHKSAAVRAGLGFIGKNTLLVTPDYGCALCLGKVLTAAPFATASSPPPEPQCGDCRVCVEACPTGALSGTAWSPETARDEMLTRKRCTLCGKCLVLCPYTVKYAGL